MSGRGGACGRTQLGLLVRSDLAQHTAHDLATARLGQACDRRTGPSSVGCLLAPVLGQAVETLCTAPCRCWDVEGLWMATLVTRALRPSGMLSV